MDQSWLTPESAVPKAIEVCDQIERSIQHVRRKQITIYSASIADRHAITDESAIKDEKLAIESLALCNQKFFCSVDIADFGDPPTWYVSDAKRLGGYLFGIQVVSWTHPAGDIAIQLRNQLQQGIRPTRIQMSNRGPATGSYLVGPLVNYRFEQGIPREARFLQAADSAEEGYDEDFSEDDARSSDFSLRSLIQDIDLSQNREIRGPMTGVFVLTGGPGVGKTSVGLHRIPYLINEQPLGTSTIANSPFFRPDNQLVLVWKEHLVPYLRSLTRELVIGFPDANVVHVQKWLMDSIRDDIKIGGRSGWELREQEPTVEAWKSDLTEFELREFLDAESQESKDYCALLFKFYLCDEVIELLSDEFSDFDEQTYVQTISSQRKQKHLSFSDATLLLWLIHFLTKGQVPSSTTPSMSSRYAHIIVDEAQYYDPRLLRFLRELVRHPDSDGVLTIIGDIEQRISVENDLLTWQDLELELTEDQIRRLTTNYRWSKEVFEIVGDLHESLGISEPLTPPFRWKVHHGQPAQIVCQPTLAHLAESSVTRIIDIRDNPRTRLWTIAVILEDSTENSTFDTAADITTRLEAAGIPARSAKGADVNNSIDKVIVTTCDHIVGLEFDAVFFLGIQVDVDAMTESARASFWVTATRARRFLFLGRLEGDDLLSDSRFDQYRSE